MIVASVTFIVGRLLLHETHGVRIGDKAQANQLAVEQA